jgi:hypothetical protein
MGFHFCWTGYTPGLAATSFLFWSFGRYGWYMSNMQRSDSQTSFASSGGSGTTMNSSYVGSGDGSTHYYTLEAGASRTFNRMFFILTISRLFIYMFSCNAGTDSQTSVGSFASSHASDMGYNAFNGVWCSCVKDRGARCSPLMVHTYTSYQISPIGSWRSSVSSQMRAHSGYICTIWSITLTLVGLS